MIGLPHEPNFKVIIQINGETFEGNGPSKQKAKSNVAVVALTRLGFGNILGEEQQQQQQQQINTSQKNNTQQKIITSKTPGGWTFEPFGTDKRK